MLGIKSKVVKGLKDRLAAMTVRHSELENDLKQKIAHVRTYDKFATLHQEMNHHSYTSQYYWVIFLLRRFIFITVCIFSSDSYWQSSTFVVLSMVASAYLYTIFPFKYSRKNYIENFNEVMIFFCGVLQLILAGYTMNTSIGSDTKGIRKGQSIS